MDIYHITYWSAPYWVQGYLALPDGCPMSERTLTTDATDGQKIAQPFAVRRLLTAEATDSQACHQTGPWPALLYCRGGIGRVGMVKLDWLRTFCAQGFVVFAPAYRGTDGAEGRDEFGGADIEDCLAAVRLLRRLPYVMAERVSVLGFSRGAVNAFRTAIEAPAIHRLIQWGGVSDLAATYEQRVDLRRMLRRVIGGTPTKVPAAYKRRSAVAHAADIPCKTLIIHGTSDVQVDVSHAHALYSALRANQRAVEQHLYEGYGHHLPEPLFTAAVERFSDWLKSDR